MKLVIVGTGYVGLVTGACFAEFGYETVCVDKDKQRVEILKTAKCPFFEPGMDDLLEKHINKTKLLKFSDSLKESMKGANIVCITVGTPSKRLEDEADLTAVWEVAKEISEETCTSNNHYRGPMHNFLLENMLKMRSGTP